MTQSIHGIPEIPAELEAEIRRVEIELPVGERVTEESYGEADSGAV
ncbi:hypothetical protein [Alteribacter natronophilus]|nr:hypothetical protein [Alteribacter natronophilus]